MLQIHSSCTLSEVEGSLRRAAERHRASIQTVASLGQLLRDKGAGAPVEAMTFSCFQADAVAALLSADIHFAAFLPWHIAAYEGPEGTVLETVSPRDFCRLLNRGDLEPMCVTLEKTLREILEEVAKPSVMAAAGSSARQVPIETDHRSTDDQVSMSGTVPQRIDGRGSKIEDLAGTGKHDSSGG